MRLSTNTYPLTAAFGEENAIKMLIESNFDAIDISCFELLYDEDCPKLSGGYKEYAKKLLSLLDGTGVCFNQGHAPHPTSRGEEKFDKSIYQKTLRSIEFCSLLGIKTIIVHPKQHLDYSNPENIKRLEELNLEFYSSLIPYCKDFNIRVAVENMWQGENGNISFSVCNRPEEFKKYLDMINSEWIVGCLDIGHANIMGNDIPTFIHTLGSKLKALHLHDTCKNEDLHILPYTVNGEDFWDPVLKALAEINYDGDLTFEAYNSIFKSPNNLKPTVLRETEKIGRYMISRFEYYKTKD